MFLSKIYVHSSARGKGYGREILDDIIRRTKEKGFNKITLTVNKNNADAIRFYVKNGFTNHGSIVQGIGEGYVMDDYMFVLNI